MTVPVFDDSLRTGNESIDSQHQWLFSLSARIAHQVAISADVPEGLAAGVVRASQEQDSIAEAIYGLIDYITEHFSDEEDLMTAAGYPGASDHKLLHDDLSSRVGGFTVRYMNGNRLAAQELVGFFNEWLTSHIMVHDRAFADWLAHRQTG